MYKYQIYLHIKKNIYIYNTYLEHLVSYPNVSKDTSWWDWQGHEVLQGSVRPLLLPGPTPGEGNGRAWAHYSNYFDIFDWCVS